MFKYGDDAHFQAASFRLRKISDSGSERGTAGKFEMGCKGSQYGSDFIIFNDKKEIKKIKEFKIGMYLFLHVPYI